MQGFINIMSLLTLSTKLRTLFSKTIIFIKDDDIMTNGKRTEQSMDFAVHIISLVRQLKEQRESIVSNRIDRSGTSVDANIRDANPCRIFEGTP